MKHPATTEEVLAEIRNERIAYSFRGDARYRCGTGDPGHMLAANAAYKTMLFEAAAESGLSWRAVLAFRLCEASTYPPLSLRLRSALVTIAGLCVAWIEAIDAEAK